MSKTPSPFEHDLPEDEGVTPLPTIRKSKPRGDSPLEEAALLSTAPAAETCYDDRHYGTIGIVACTPKGAENMATLGKEIVRAGSMLGITNDSDHPNTLQAYHPEITMAMKVIEEWGCDFLIVAKSDRITEARWNEDSQSFIELKEVEFDTETIAQYTHHLVKEAIAGSEWRLANVNLPRQWSDVKLPIEVEEALVQNSEMRRSHTKCKKGDDQFALLIVGGAGPMAGHQLMQDFIAQQDRPVIHMAMNGCPGKYLYTSGQGPSFLKHLYNVTENLGRYCQHMLTACNTNHIVMYKDLGGARDGWLPESMQEKVIHFGRALSQTLKSTDSANDRFILFATTSTVESGLYNEAVPNLDKLSAADQEMVMEGIFAVKAGHMDRARDNFLEVAGRVPEGTQIIAACTEVMLPFRGNDLRDELHFVCVVEQALKYYQEKVSQTPKESPKKPSAKKGVPLKDLTQRQYL